jgi:peptidyl-prolyl cis-trans isomerase SurA
MRKFLMPAVLLFLMFTALPAKAEIIDRVVASIGDNAITHFDVEKEGGALFKQIISSTPAEEQEVKLKDAREKALNNLIEKVLLLRAARKAGIDVTADEVRAAIENIKRENKINEEELLSALKKEGIDFERYKEEVKGQIIRSKVIDKRVRGVIGVSDEEVMIYYERNKNDFATDEEIRARHIIFLIPKAAGEERVTEIRKRAEEVLEKASAGEDFEALAKKYSEGPSASNGGDLGFFKREDMVKEFSSAVFPLKENEISGLILTPFGYHIVQLLERRGGAALPFEEISKKIKARLYSEELKRGIKEFIEGLKEEEHVEIML